MFVVRSSFVLSLFPFVFFPSLSSPFCAKKVSPCLVSPSLFRLSFGVMSRATLLTTEQAQSAKDRVQFCTMKVNGLTPLVASPPCLSAQCLHTRCLITCGGGMIVSSLVNRELLLACSRADGAIGHGGPPRPPPSSLPTPQNSPDSNQ